MVFNFLLVKASMLEQNIVYRSCTHIKQGSERESERERERFWYASSYRRLFPNIRFYRIALVVSSTFKRRIKHGKCYLLRR
jgi:hypothetical protein